MIELRERAYDDPAVQVLVDALKDEIDVRYAYAMTDWTPAQRAEDDAAYRAEIEPAQVAPPLGALLVVEVDGQVVACGAVKPLDRAAGIGEIKRMFVLAEHRGQGHSRRILTALEARAAELGYRRLQLETGLAQPEAMALYESAGWQRIPPYGRYSDADDSVCYGKDLPVPPGTGALVGDGEGEPAPAR